MADVWSSLTDHLGWFAVPIGYIIASFVIIGAIVKARQDSAKFIEITIQLYKHLLILRSKLWRLIDKLAFPNRDKRRELENLFASEAHNFWSTIDGEQKEMT